MSKPPPRKIKIPTGPTLTKYLKALAVEAETILPDGDVLTKAAALADLVWKSALGWRETDVKTGEEIVHPTDWRAVELLFNRIEGKTISAPPEDSGHSLVEKVTEMGRARANSLAKAAAEDDDPDAD